MTATRDQQRSSTERPTPDAILSALKPFQRATVEHTFHRLWADQDRVDRFLVADEVGLGKTLVAKGVAARAIDHLWDQDRPITIVYVCSNGQIAKQNLQRLRDLTGGEVQDNADRLTLLPATMGQGRGDRVQLISFTPGTSFRLGNATGTAPERALVHWMLSQDSVLGRKEMRRSAWTSYLACNAGVEGFKHRLTWEESRPPLDEQLVDDFALHLRTAPGPTGGELLDELREDLDTWARSGRGRGPELHRRRNDFVSRLRMAMAHVSVERLDPDLVILDEFQRFKDLFPSEDTSDQDHQVLSEPQRLARRVITTERAKVLVLSATPYKMYTLPDEPDSEDHYRDFTRTIAFLAGPTRAAHVTDRLGVMRRAALSGDEAEIAAGKAARAEVEVELRRVMTRTERLAATPDRSGMLSERKLGPMELTAKDVKGWLADDALAAHVGSRDAFEFWRSTPYAPNLMDRTAYQVQERLHDAITGGDSGLAELLHRHRDGLLSWEDIEQYRAIDPANAKMRALIDDVMSHEAWRLAWLPPSLEYVAPAGPYGSAAARSFTKRLVFSAWGVVPKAISVMVSYEAERRALEVSGRLSVEGALTYTAKTSTMPLRFGWDHARNRPRNLAHLTLMHPSITLAELGDPLRLARDHGLQLPLNPDLLLRIVRERIQERLDEIGIRTTAPPEQTRNWEWYGMAPYLLDRALLGSRDEFSRRLRRWTRNVPDSDGPEEPEEGQSAAGRRTAKLLEDTISYAASAVWDGTGGPSMLSAETAELGSEAPSDLADVLAAMAVAAPGVCALRALSRVCGGQAVLSDHAVRGAAFTIAEGLRTLFNRPEIVTAVRSTASDDLASDSADAYWRQVLRYSQNGNLQAVLDEYVHTLVESEGLKSAAPPERAHALAERIAGTSSIRTAINTIQDIRVTGDRAGSEERHVNSHLAARFGRAQTQDQAAEREASVRQSFNSPFWPFVLASTSVGQEGLDFHTYSHAVVHWNLPSNPVDLEQREGRVHRYKGHAVRKNVSATHGAVVLNPDVEDPWTAMFDAAELSRPVGDPLINPYWVFPLEEGATIERYVPTNPLSREARHHGRLLRTLSEYRRVMGQPRQAELLEKIRADTEWMLIDLSPPSASGPGSHSSTPASATS
ncbi:helicase-related protein [Brachybacterium sp. GCM10030268]|uniref:helicase-related protein n=1 Tax=Brachybacterium sp. GCM10030268 TaxID=3273382 RepID=UPI003605FADA